MRVPVFRRFDASRSLTAFSALTPHDELGDEINADPGISERLERMCARQELPASYFSHPVVLSSEAPVHAFALYVDGINFERLDNIIGFFVYNLITGHRHCVASIRKSQLCRCGCRGWCSLFPIFTFLRWSFLSIQNGRFPITGPFGEPLIGSRLAQAGLELGWKGVLVLIKADLAEVASTFGVPSWRSNAHPCFLCTATVRNLYECQNISPVSQQHSAKTLDDYLASCASCEIHVTVRTEEERTQLVDCLAADGNRDRRGRFMKKPLAALGLRKNDRLEPSTTVPDTHTWELLVLPIVLTFWRGQGITHHRNPLFCTELRVSLHDVFAVDWLHTLSLGIFQDFCGELVNTLIRLDAFPSAGSTEEARRLSAVAALQAQLFAFYAAEVKAGRTHTQVQRLDASMFGTDLLPACKLHGGETNGFLHFCEILIQKYRVLLSTPDLWLRLNYSLLRIYRLCHKPVFGARDHQDDRFRRNVHDLSIKNDFINAAGRIFSS